MRRISTRWRDSSSSSPSLGATSQTEECTVISPRHTSAFHLFKDKTFYRKIFTIALEQEINFRLAFLYFIYGENLFFPLFRTFTFLDPAYSQ